MNKYVFHAWSSTAPVVQIICSRYAMSAVLITKLVLMEQPALKNHKNRKAVPRVIGEIKNIYVLMNAQDMM